MSRRPAVGFLIALAVSLTTLVAAPAAVAADRDCGDFASQRDAQIFFLNQGGPHSDPHRLDSDGDGIACESNPAPYYYATTLPSGGGGEPEPAPQPQVTNVRSTVDLSVVPSTRIAGESFRLRLSVRPKISRKVLVQRKVYSRWKTFATGVTGRNGTTSGVFKAPSATTSYRAVVRPVKKGNTKYSAATSRARAVSIERQQVVLTFGQRSVAEGEQVRAVVRATPVRAGRPVVLQMRSTGVWRTVRSSTFDRRGRASFTITPALGQRSYRAVAKRHRGATAAESRTTTLTALDVTPPPAPYDLVAVPGDGTVTLSWSRGLPSDFAHHQVWMRTSGTAWSRVTVTGADSVVLSLLQNDTLHWFTVTSVDVSGNESEMAPEVEATPTAAGQGVLGG